MKKDYYEILGVDKSATKEEIKHAYRTKAKELHPDINTDSTDTEFQLLNEANDVLSDDVKRKQYDYKTNFSHFNVYDFDSFTNGFRNWNEHPKYEKRIKKGSDHKATIDLTLEDVYNGFHKKIKILRNNKCDVCSGIGYDVNSTKIKCNICNGNGYTDKERRMMFSIETYREECPHCDGDGYTYQKICESCNGGGFKTDYSIINIDIPKGSFNNHYVLKNDGNFIKNGLCGDLHILINYLPHDVFKRIDNDIYYDLHIGVLDSIYGSKINLPTLNGDVSLKITKGTQNGKLLRLGKKGLPILNTNDFGDQYINVVIDIPSDVTDEELLILKNLESDKWLKGVVYGIEN